MGDSQSAEVSGQAVTPMELLCRTFPARGALTGRPLIHVGRPPVSKYHLINADMSCSHEPIYMGLLGLSFFLSKQLERSSLLRDKP
jgi:hypothetical protein